MVAIWSLGYSSIGSSLATAGGLCLFSRDFSWAQQPLLLCFPFLGQLFQGFPLLLLCFLGLLCFGQETAWGVLVELHLGTLYSFLLVELFWVPLPLAGKVDFLLTGWILGVTWSLLPSGREDLARALPARSPGASPPPKGCPWHARFRKDGWFLLPQSDLWVRCRWF